MRDGALEMAPSVYRSDMVRMADVHADNLGFNSLRDGTMAERHLILFIPLLMVALPDGACGERTD